MTGVVDLAARRWMASNNPADSTPRDALVEAIRRIDASELAPDHVVIVLAVPDPDEPRASTVHRMQAGALTYFGAVGLLSKALAEAVA